MRRAAVQVPYVAEDAKRELARRAREELEKRRLTDSFRDAVILALREELFPQQLCVLDDPAPRLALCGSRRSGKSELVARMIAITLLRSGHNVHCIFAARTLSRARQIVWPLLVKIDHDYGLGWRLSEHIGQIVTPRGAVFTLLGVDDSVSVEKVRGSKYALAVCDEASTYENLLERLIIDCVEPGTIDIKPRGRILLCGTPGYTMAGYWHSVATGLRPGWKHYYWTLRENPHIPDVEASLKAIREANDWDTAHPTYRREYLGQWVADESTLVYAVMEGRNTCAESDLPEPPVGRSLEQWIRDEWLVSVGADIGYTDAFAVVAIGSPPHSKEMYVLACHTQELMRAEEQAAAIQQFRIKYRPKTTVIDAGGAGKMVHAEFNSRYGQLLGGPAAPATKMGKVEAIGMMNNDLRVGRLRVVLPAAKDLYREWCTLVWGNEEKTKPHKHQADHCSDACLYTWRAHRAYLSKALPDAKTPEQLENEAQERRLQQAARGRVRR